MVWELGGVEVAVGITATVVLFAVLIAARMLRPSIIALIRHWVLFSVVLLLVRVLAALIMPFLSVASEGNAATISFSVSPLNDKRRLLTRGRHEVGVAIVLVALLVSS